MRRAAGAGPGAERSGAGLAGAQLTRFSSAEQSSGGPTAMSLQHLEEELTCSVCYSLFEDPRVLPCSHTFCKTCVEGVLQLSNTSPLLRLSKQPLKCPSCRSVLEISSAELLPVNFALKAIVEKYQEEGHVSVATCSKHHRQPLNVYCLLDRKLVCGHCLTIGEHKGHPIDDVQSAYLKEKKVSGKLIEQLTDKYWTDVCLLLEKLKEQKSQCEGIVQDDKKAVVQYFKKFSETLESKKQALLIALDEVNTHILEKYEPLIENLKKLREEQLQLMSLNTDLQKEESPLVFLEKVDDLQRRIRALKEKQLPVVKPVEIYPRVAYLLKEVWSKTEIGHINKILAPKIKLIPKRKLCVKGGGREGGECKELLQAVDPLAVLLLSGLVVVTALSFLKPVSSAVIEATPACISEFLLPVYQGFNTHLQDAVDVLCHRFHLLMEFLGRIVSLQVFQ